MSGGNEPREQLVAFMADWQPRRDAHEKADRELLAERDGAMRDAYEAGVIQTDIAKVVGLTQQSVSRIVKG